MATNILHTYLPTVQMPSGLTLAIAARIGAGIWPLGLLLSIEVLARVTWRRGVGWSIARFGGAGAVAFGSAVISYSHVRDVLLAWGYGHPAAEFGPITLDGLMVVCGFALLSLTPRSDSPADEPDPAEVPTRNRIHDPRPTLGREIPLTAQIEALPIPHRAAIDAVATMSGHSEVPVPQADTETDARRQRARDLQAQGWTHGRIATELAVSKRTVRRYLSTQLDIPETTGYQADIEVDTPRTPAGSGTPEFDWLTDLSTNHDHSREGALS
ncbi:DUF2637 domain-containing protein [Nocardia sp. NPDC059764]|uniref:DUF2637 domain-containing protein n=1 Tax=Nocardia sp. NPDC059764 TaxID=3346939 RepID=UPI003658B947